jgi:hypothetical protein
VQPAPAEDFLSFIQQPTTRVHSNASPPLSPQQPPPQQESQQGQGQGQQRGQGQQEGRRSQSLSDETGQEGVRLTFSVASSASSSRPLSDGSISGGFTSSPPPPSL